MTADSRMMSKLKKLLALARQGVGGEKDNAQSVLDKLLARHGMTIADLDDSAQVRERRWFKPKNQRERTLLNQCIRSILGKAWDGSCWRIPRRSERGYDLTNVEYAQADLLFEIHRRAMGKFIEAQMKVAVTAYVHKNNLFAVDDDDDGARDKLSPADMAHIAAIVAMMQGMQRTPVHKALTHTFRTLH